MAEHDIGIKFTAKAQLQAINDVINKLGNLDDKTIDLVETMIKLGDKGSEGVGRLIGMYAELSKAQDEVRQQSGKATAEQIKNIKDLQKEMKSFEAGLRIQQKEGVDPYTAQIKRIDDSLRTSEKQYRREGKGEEAEIIRMARQEGKGLIAENRARTQIIGQAGQLPTEQPEGGGSNMLLAMGAGLTSTLGKLMAFLGVASLLGKGVKAWGDYDIEMKKVEARFGTLGTASTVFRKQVLAIEGDLGIHQKELAKLFLGFQEQLGGLATEQRVEDFAQLMGFSRTVGISPGQAIGIEAMSRYLDKPVRLQGFEDFADRTDMKTRMPELIGVMNSLTQMSATARLDPMAGVQPSSIYEAISGLFEGQRGMGVRAGEFTGRLQAGVTGGGSQAAERLKMRAAGLGSRDFIEVMKTMQAGLTGMVGDKPYMIAIMEQIEREVGGNKVAKYMAAQEVFGNQLKYFEIEALMDMSPLKRQRFSEALSKDMSMDEAYTAAGYDFSKKQKDYLKSGADATSIVDQMVVKATNVAIIGGEALAAMLRGDRREFDKEEYSAFMSQRTGQLMKELRYKGGWTNIGLRGVQRQTQSDWNEKIDTEIRVRIDPSDMEKIEKIPGLADEIQATLLDILESSSREVFTEPHN